MEKKHHAIKFGKPSISIRAMASPWRTVSHNQARRCPFGTNLPTQNIQNHGSSMVHPVTVCELEAMAQSKVR